MHTTMLLCLDFVSPLVWPAHLNLLPPSQVNPTVFMDVAISGRPLGRVVMELKEDVVPKTA